MVKFRNKYFKLFKLWFHLYLFPRELSKSTWHGMKPFHQKSDVCEWRRPLSPWSHLCSPASLSQTGWHGVRALTPVGCGEHQLTSVLCPTRRLVNKGDSFFLSVLQNPSPGLFAVMHPLTYAETLIDYHLCSHPKYRFTKESHSGSSIPLTQKQFLHHTVRPSPCSLAELALGCRGRQGTRRKGHSWNWEKEGLQPQPQDKDGNHGCGPSHTISPKEVQVGTQHHSHPACAYLPVVLFSTLLLLLFFDF